MLTIPEIKICNKSPYTPTSDNDQSPHSAASLQSPCITLQFHASRITSTDSTSTQNSPQSLAETVTPVWQQPHFLGVIQSNCSKTENRDFSKQLNGMTDLWSKDLRFSYHLLRHFSSFDLYDWICGRLNWQYRNDQKKLIGRQLCINKHSYVKWTDLCLLL